jgi:hypothetical protein
MLHRPADKKWFRNFAAARIVREVLEAVDPRFSPAGLGSPQDRISVMNLDTDLSEPNPRKADLPTVRIRAGPYPFLEIAFSQAGLNPGLVAPFRMRIRRATLLDGRLAAP